MKRLSKVQAPIQVTVMGCVVNGPGESCDADEARLVYPSDGALGPVSLGRTRKSCVLHSLDQQRGTEPGSAKASLRRVPLPLLSQREVP